MAVSVVLILLGVWLNRVFPDWFMDRMIQKRSTLNIKNIFQTAHMPPFDLQAFNTDKLSKTPDHKTEVLVVGAGPIGLTTALLLQQHGIDVMVIEKHPGVSTHPKARGISCRSMGLFRRLGFLKQVEAHNLPPDQKGFVWCASLLGQVYARVEATTNYQSLSPCRPGSAVQMDLERVMLEQFEQQGGQVHFKHELVEIAQNEHLVQASLLNRDTKKAQTIEAKYLIAADGIHSTVRKGFGIPLFGPADLSTKLSVFCEMDVNASLESKRPFNIAFVVNPKGPAPMMLAIDGKKRWLVIFPSAGLEPEAIERIYTDDYIKLKIQQVVGTQILDIQILDKKVWRLGSQVANQFKAGRTILAGDSIHQFSPTGGMGINTGLQDADNLAWKLAYVLRDKAKPEILETYTAERVPSILNNMQWSINNLNRLVRTQRTLAGKTPNPENVAALAEAQKLHLNKSGIDLGTIYTSNLVAPSDAPPTIAPDQYVPNTYPGARLPHFELKKGKSVISSLDLIGTDFILLCSVAAADLAKKLDFQSISTSCYTLGETGDLQEVQIGRFAELHQQEEFGALWLRPEGHIAWRGCLDQAADLAKLNALIKWVAVAS